MLRRNEALDCSGRTSRPLEVEEAVLLHCEFGTPFVEYAVDGANQAFADPARFAPRHREHNAKHDRQGLTLLPYVFRP